MFSHACGEKELMFLIESHDISSHVCSKFLQIFLTGSQDISSWFCRYKNKIFFQQDICSVCGDQNKYFKQKTWCFPNPNQVVFVPKP